jgi:hypothetical protein
MLEVYVEASGLISMEWHGDPLRRVTPQEARLLAHELLTVADNGERLEHEVAAARRAKMGIAERTPRHRSTPNPRGGY